MAAMVYFPDWPERHIGVSSAVGMKSNTLMEAHNVVTEGKK